jgi:DNA adenine methylase
MISPTIQRSAVRWAGGKRWAIKHILPKISPHTCYVEAFAGGIATLLNKERSDIEVINDTHADLVNLYRCARFHPEELDRELRLTLSSRMEFKDFIAQPGLTDIQRAGRWYYRNRTCWGDNEKSFAVGRTGGAFAGAQLARQRLVELAERLDGVSIESMDWSRCLDLYDGPATFFLLDPPYVGGGQLQYASWTMADMEGFAAKVQALRGKWLVTVNDSPELRELFAFGRQTRFQRHLGIANKAGGGQPKYGELFIEKPVVNRKSPRGSKCVTGF